MILNAIYRFFFNRPNIGPGKAEGPCQVPGCTNPATENWFPSVCALREAGVEIDWVAVCDEHDVQMNEQTVRGAYGDRYDVELAAYRERRLG